jgi:hypothetical protein
MRIELHDSCVVVSRAPQGGLVKTPVILGGFAFRNEAATATAAGIERAPRSLTQIAELLD